MKNVEWFNDQMAQSVYGHMRLAMQSMIAAMCPSHELSHMGFSRNHDTDEVVIKLHLNPLGSVRVVDAPTREDGKRMGMREAIGWRNREKA